MTKEPESCCVVSPHRWLAEGRVTQKFENQLDYSIKTHGTYGLMIVRNTEISCTGSLYIIKTDQESGSLSDLLQEIKEAARLEKTD